MTNWALKHKQKVLAKKAAGEWEAPTSTANNQPTDNIARARQKLNLFNDAIEQDLVELDKINDHASRRDLKKTLIDKYWEYVNEFMAGEFTFPNPVIGRVLIWLFDTWEFERGFALALLMIAKGQSLPPPFTRDVQTFVADSVLEWGELQLTNGNSPEPYLTKLIELIADKSWVINEKIVAKVYKLKGLVCFNANAFEQAVKFFDLALRFNPKVGVKTKRDEAAAKLKVLATNPEAVADADQPPATTD